LKCCCHLHQAKSTTYHRGMPDRITVGLVETAWGPMVLASSERGIALVERGDDLASAMSALRRRLPGGEASPGPPDHAAWLAAWVDGRRRDLAPVDLRGLPAFDTAVYGAVRDIGWGERATYGDVAVAIGHPGAARAVGGAMGRCPLFPSVPCHRVVRAADGWSGWGVSGNALKRDLLARERR
jgi:O-6-methylguanine DNA methyltransferase